MLKIEICPKPSSKKNQASYLWPTKPASKVHREKLPIWPKYYTKDWNLDSNLQLGW
jgi:hypothetical protein